MDRERVGYTYAGTDSRLLVRISWHQRFSIVLNEVLQTIFFGC